MLPPPKSLRPAETLTSAPGALAATPTLAAKNVSKAFGPVTVLEGITLEFFAGEIHAIVGENGAGKSTLVNILAGLIKPSSGEVLFRGKRVETGNLREMENLGVRFIHQELNLAEDLTVVENLFLGEELAWGPFLDETRMREKGRELLAEVGAEVDLDARVNSLRVSEKQMVEIAKAIAQRATVLILDEPTAVLTRREGDRLFQIVQGFAQTGVAIATPWVSFNGLYTGSESGNSPLQNMPFLLVLVVVMFIIMLLPDFTLFLANFSACRRQISTQDLLDRYFNAYGNFVLVVQAALRPTA